MGTDHHQSLSNHVVVAMVTRLMRLYQRWSLALHNGGILCVCRVQPCQPASRCPQAGLKVVSLLHCDRILPEVLRPDLCPFSEVWLSCCDVHWLVHPRDDAPWVATCPITVPTLTFFSQSFLQPWLVWFQQLSRPQAIASVSVCCPFLPQHWLENQAGDLFLMLSDSC